MHSCEYYIILYMYIKLYYILYYIILIYYIKLYYINTYIYIYIYIYIFILYILFIMYIIYMNLNKKYYLPITTWNKKHSSKQAVPITYTLGKVFCRC